MRLLVLLLGISIVLGCSGGKDKGSPDRLSGVEQFFTAGATSSADIGPAGGEVSLGNDIRLSIAANSLEKATKITLSRYDRKLDPAVPDPFSSGALIVVVDTSTNVAELDPPAKLLIPMAAEDTLALTYRDGQWAPIQAEASGSGLQINIEHFSKTTSAFLQLGEWLASGEVPRAWEPLHRAAVEAADTKTQQFYGVGELSKRNHADMCREFRDLLLPLLANPVPGATTVPSDAPTVASMASYLKHGDAPGLDAQRAKPETNPYYWKKTEASMPVIRERMRAAGHRLSPAEVLVISVNANGGNIPLGVLAAHSILKDATYQGRLNGDPKPEGAEWVPGLKVDVEARHAEIAALMQPWRTTSAWSPKGRYDKMGPIYHIFATMLAATWHGEWFGEVAENGEAFLRYFGIGSDVYDPEKGAGDACGREIGDWIRNPEPLVFFQPVDGPVAIDKPVAITLVLRGLKEQNGVTFRVVEGEAMIAKSVIQADPNNAAPECDKVGRELLCGNTVTPTKDAQVRIEAAYKGGTATITLKPAPPKSLTLVSQTITRASCQVDEGNVRAGSPFTQRCSYTVALTLNYSADVTPSRIFCGIGPTSAQTSVSTKSGSVSLTAQFSILVQPGVGRTITPSGCMLEDTAGNAITRLSLETIVQGP